MKFFKLQLGETNSIALNLQARTEDGSSKWRSYEEISYCPKVVKTTKSVFNTNIDFKNKLLLFPDQNISSD